MKQSPPSPGEIFQGSTTPRERAIGGEHIHGDLQQIRQELRLGLAVSAPEILNIETNVCTWPMQVQFAPRSISSTLDLVEPAKEEVLSHRPPGERAAHRASS